MPDNAPVHYKYVVLCKTNDNQLYKLKNKGISDKREEPNTLKFTLKLIILCHMTIAFEI